MPNNKVVRLVEGGGYRPSGDANKKYFPPKGAGTGVRSAGAKRNAPAKQTTSKKKN
jgi:hypothetical protein